MRDRFFAISFGRDYRCSATVGNRFADMITVMTAICQEHAGCRQIIIDQNIEALEVGDLAAGYFRPNRQAVSVGNELDFGREATF